jgi:hypothetical protein
MSAYKHSPEVTDPLCPWCGELQSQHVGGDCPRPSRFRLLINPNVFIVRKNYIIMNLLPEKSPPGILTAPTTEND